MCPLSKCRRLCRRAAHSPLQSALTAELTRLETLTNQREHEIHRLKRTMQEDATAHARELRASKGTVGSEALTKVRV